MLPFASSLLPGPTKTQRLPQDRLEENGPGAFIHSSGRDSTVSTCLGEGLPVPLPGLFVLWPWVCLISRTFAQGSPDSSPGWTPLFNKAPPSQEVSKWLWGQLLHVMEDNEGQRGPHPTGVHGRVRVSILHNLNPAKPPACYSQ